MSGEEGDASAGVALAIGSDVGSRCRPLRESASKARELSRSLASASRAKKAAPGIASCTAVVAATVTSCTNVEVCAHHPMTSQRDGTMTACKLCRRRWKMQAPLSNEVTLLPLAFQRCAAAP